MQDIVFYAAANETLGVVRDYANARKMPTPVLTLGVSVCLRMRLFSALDTAEPYPVAAFDDITDWQWRMDGDFDRDTTCKLVADVNGISVHSVTDTVNGETMDFTEFVIPISNMNTQELAAWLGNEPKRTGLTGELVGYDSEEHAVFVLQIDNFTVRNRVAGLGTPTAMDQEIVTRTTAEHMIRTAVSAMGNTKQDKLTSSNAGSGISITGDGVIGMANVPQNAISGLSDSFAAKQDNLTAGYRMELIGGSTVGQKRYFQVETPSGTSITLQSGHAYRINATTGQKTLNAEAMNANEIGLEGHMELFLANTGFIQTGANVVLANALEPDAVNNCTVRFHNGRATISVEDHVAGYIVTVNAASGAGSLAYGLATAANEYISVDASLNGQTFDLAGATTYAGEKHIVGNGYENTVISGCITCTDKTTVSNLSLRNVAVNGGTLTLGDAFIPSGSTVAVSSGGLAVEKVTGDGGMIDLSGALSAIKVSGTAYISGCTVTRISADAISDGGLFIVSAGNTLSAFDCVLSGASANYGGGLWLTGSANLTSCTARELRGGAGGGYYLRGGRLTVSGCDLIGTMVCRSASDIKFTGSNRFGGRIIPFSTDTTATVTIAPGAIVDLTDNTYPAPIAPGGRVFIGSDVRINPSAGSVSAVEISGGTYSAITNGGVILGPVSLENNGTISGNAVVDFSGTGMIVSGTTASADGVTFTGGGDTTFKLNAGGELHLSGVTMYGNNGAYGDILTNASTAVCTLTDCDITFVTMFAGSCHMNGSNTLHARLTSTGDAADAGGHLFIAPDAVLDLTGNTVSRAVYPGKGIVISGGPVNSGTKIIGSAGSATQTREFEDVVIHGTSISNQGIIYGATVTIPDSRIYYLRYTVNGGLSSSSMTITGPTVYALTDNISSMAGLTSIVNT